jgi:hypothetical protein
MYVHLNQNCVCQCAESFCILCALEYRLHFPVLFYMKINVHLYDFQISCLQECVTNWSIRYIQFQ